MAMGIAARVVAVPPRAVVAARARVTLALNRAAAAPVAPAATWRPVRIAWQPPLRRKRAQTIAPVAAMTRAAPATCLRGAPAILLAAPIAPARVPGLCRPARCWANRASRIAIAHRATVRLGFLTARRGATTFRTVRRFGIANRSAPARKRFARSKRIFVRAAPLVCWA